MKNIIAYYNKSTKKPICYIIGTAKVTLKLKECYEFINPYSYLIKNSKEMLNDIYNGNDHGNMLEHEFFHIKKDYFSDISKSNIKIIVRTKNEEIQNIRKLKLINITIL